VIIALHSVINKTKTWRNYDPALGRLNQVDLMADKYGSLSPYHYSFNNPVWFNDPSGLDPEGGGDGFYGPGPCDPWDRQPGAGDLQRALGGSGQIKSDGSGGYFRDSNGDGIQNGDEQNVGFSDIINEYGWRSANYYGGSDVDVKNGQLGTWSNYSYTSYTYAYDEDGNLRAYGTPTTISKFKPLIRSSGNGSDPFAAGQFVFDTGATFYGGAGMAIQAGRQANGGRAIARFLGGGTQNAAKALTRTGTIVGKIGGGIGTAGYVLQAVSVGYKYSTGQRVSTADNVGFGISTLLVGGAAIAAGTAAAPFVAGAAVIYGVGELGSFLFTGQSLEANIFGND
jgi:hypothetical protein